jgi:hypothetical protein
MTSEVIDAPPGPPHPRAITSRKEIAMSTIAQSRLLRLTLLVDGLVSGAMGLLLLAGGGLLADLLGLPETLLRGAGVVLLPFAAWVLWLGRTTQPNARGAIAVIAVNIAWVAASLLLLVAGWVTPTGLGIAFVIVQAAAVGLFAQLQHVGWRRAVLPVATAAPATTL